MKQRTALFSISKIVFWNAIILLIIFFLLELVGSLCFHNPKIVPSPFLRGLRHFYFTNARNIIQVSPECGQYNSELSYTLRPGTCSFSNVEFSTDYRINSFGVRDDEVSLDAPEVIVLGDSYAMGWGVEEEDTFASILEKQTGKKVLNLGMSSYGTAREVKILQKADLSKLKYLIIQYCDNDYFENQSFFENHNSLPIMSEDDYNKAVRSQNKKEYYWGKYVLKLIPAMIRYPFKGLFFADEEDEVNPSDEATQFLNVLQTLPATSDLNIIIFEMTEFAKNDNKFTSALKQALKEKKISKNITVLDVSKDINSKDYFLIDSHIRTSGHRMIAERIIEYL